jgi:hypothetical protein
VLIWHVLVARRFDFATDKPAEAKSIVKDGAVIAFEVVRGGSGYSSPPTVTVPGIKTGEVKVTLSYGKDLEKNVSVSAIALAAAAADARAK